MADDLMVRLARILQADTVDLRQLARMAGADPASFYVGTNLEGVDIRGQDLRGMKLPGLELDKVRKDEATQVDDLDPQGLADGADVLLYADYPGVSGFIRLPGGLVLGVFGREDRSSFIKAAEQVRGRVLLCAPATDLTGLFVVAEALDHLGMAYFCLAIEPYGDRYRSYRQLPMQGMLQRVILVSGSLREGRISGEARDLIPLLLLNWFEALESIPQPFCVFLRKSGSGGDPRGDAGARILEEAVARGFGVGENVVFLPPDYRLDAFAETPGWELMLEPSRVVLMNTSKYYDLAVLMAPAKRTGDLETYARAVARALAGRGWRGVVVQHDKEVELHLSLARQELDIDVLPPRKSSTTKGFPGAQASYARYSIPQADKIGLMPEASLGRVTQALVAEGILLLSARDLLGASPTPDTIWPFIGAQLTRVMEGRRLADQMPYLRLLLSTAIEAQAVDHSDVRLFIDIVEGRMPSSFRLKVGNFREEEGGVVRAEMGVLDRSGEGPDQFVAHAHLLIDRAGVSIGEAPPLRAEFRRAMAVEQALP